VKGEEAYAAGGGGGDVRGGSQGGSFLSSHASGSIELKNSSPSSWISRVISRYATAADTEEPPPTGLYTAAVGEKEEAVALNGVAITGFTLTPPLALADALLPTPHRTPLASPLPAEKGGGVCVRGDGGCARPPACCSAPILY
jgi:hypothetical protein